MIWLAKCLRLAAAVAGTAALNLGCWSWCHDDRAAALASPARADLPVLIAGLAAALLQVALAWLLVLTVLIALEPLAGRDLTSYAGCPAGLRRILLAWCGAAALGVLTVPAQAAPVSPAPTDQQPSAVLDGLQVPDRTLGALHRRVPRERSVLVRRGDTLWGIAAARLPAGAGCDDVGRAWRLLYDVNRSRVGSDPDLIMPGTRLRLPPQPPPHQEDDR
ncbi:MAG: hypothetical protein ABI873_07930 [Marmoricola sp.]